MFYNVNIDRKLTLDYFPTRCFKGMLLSFLPFASTTSDQEPTCISTHAPSTNWTVWRVITYSEAKKQFFDEKALEQRLQSRLYFNTRSTNTKNTLKKKNESFAKGVYYINKIKKGVKRFLLRLIITIGTFKFTHLEGAWNFFRKQLLSHLT